MSEDLPTIEQTALVSSTETGPSHASAPARPSSVPSKVGRYEIEGPLGAGGMGVVLRGRDPELDRPVAVKLLHTRRTPASSEQQTRLYREAQALAALSHPNVLTVYEVGTHEGAWRSQVFIAMELVEGITLQAWTRERAKGWADVVRMYVQAGRGLHAAHVRGLVHRDFKPANVLVGDDGRARVLDFGLATLDGNVDSSRTGDGSSSGAPVVLDAFEDDLTALGTVVGTPAYMAPEQHIQDPVTAASDQFSFCVALWEALTHERPFVGHDLPSLREALFAGRRRPIPKGLDVPRSVLRLLDRGMERHPEDRWPTLEALLDRLDTQIRPRRRWPWGVAAVVVLGGGLALALAPTATTPCETDDRSAPFGEVGREALGSAFEGDDALLRAWPEVERALSDYDTAWVDGYARICTAGIAGAGDQPTFDLRMGCLHQRRDSARAVLGVLERDDASTLIHAGEAVARLPPVSECEEATVGNQATALPADPVQAKTVTELRARLSGVEALTGSGRLAEAEAEAEAVLQEATALGFGPVLVEAELRLGVVRSRRGRPQDAEPLLSSAFWRASDVDYPKLGSEAAIELAWQVGYLQGRHAEGIEWARHYESAARRAGSNPDRNLPLVLGPIYFDWGKLEQARPYLEQHLQETLGEHGDQHDVAVARMNLANLLDELGEEEQAAEEYRLAQEIFEQIFPEGHPDLALALINRSNVVYSLRGELEAAMAMLQRGVRMSIAINGELHPVTGLGLMNLAGLHGERGELGAELALLGRARAAYAEGGQVERLLLEHQWADALRRADRLDAARAHWDAVLGALEAEPSPGGELEAAVHRGLGELDEARGELPAAQQEYATALAMMANEPPAERLDLEVALGRVRVTQGDAEGRQMVAKAHAWALEHLGAEHPRTKEIGRSLDRLPPPAR